MGPTYAISERLSTEYKEISRIASNVVNLQLISSKCNRVLLYGLEA